MAPDLSHYSGSPRLANATNTVSSSTHISPNLSRRTSSVMGPPPAPQNGSLPSSPRPPHATMDTSGMGGTTGPIRHPRPLTAAELHLEMEKEQESIVNRLTRELAGLRAQTASVASTASSTSDLFTSNPSDHIYSYQSGITPTSARRHRSSSNLSSRSARSARDALANSASVTSVSGVAAPRERERENTHSNSHQASSRPSIDIPRPDMSRQNSMSGVYRTGSNTAQVSTTSPAWVLPPGGTVTHQQPSSRHSMSSTYSTTGVTSQIGDTRSPGSNTGMTATSRYEEAALQRMELEAVKRENEMLKTRIRELERSLSAHHAESGHTPKADSVTPTGTASANASVTTTTNVPTTDDGGTNKT